MFKPGEFIQEEMDERGWSQSELATAMGCVDAVVDWLITGWSAIGAYAAMMLSKAFGTSAEFWLNLEVNYQRVLLKKLQTAPAIPAAEAK